MNPFKKYIFFGLVLQTPFIWGMQSESDTKHTSNLEDTSHLNTVPEHTDNENFEEDFGSLYKTIRKEAINKGIINKDSAPSNTITLNEDELQSITTPSGIAICGNELDLIDSIKAIGLTQTKMPSNFFSYSASPHQPGVWELININKIDFKGKRVALIVHGHHTTSLLDALTTHLTTKIKNLLFCVKPTKTPSLKPSDCYGLDNLVNLGRMLYQDIYDGNNNLRYDYVIGYGYSSWGSLKDLSKKFALEVNASNLNEAKQVELFARSMGGVMARWALEHEGLGEWIHNCVFIASPHQGVPFCLSFSNNQLPNIRHEIISITPSPLISTTDLITRNLELDEYASDFLNELAFKKSPYSEKANYHTLGGYQPNTLTWAALKEGDKPTPQNLCPGAVIQKYNDCRFGKNKIPCDGLVSLYSAHSEYLKNKSYGYHSGRYPTPIKIDPETSKNLNLLFSNLERNNISDKDYPHAFSLPLDHRTLLGDDLEPTIFDLEVNDTPYKKVLPILQYWIGKWED